MRVWGWCLVACHGTYACKTRSATMLGWTTCAGGMRCRPSRPSRAAKCTSLTSAPRSGELRRTHFPKPLTLNPKPVLPLESLLLPGNAHTPTAGAIRQKGGSRRTAEPRCAKQGNGSEATRGRCELLWLLGWKSQGRRAKVGEILCARSLIARRARFPAC